LHAPVVLEDADLMGVQAMADSAVLIRARVKVSPGKQVPVQRDFLRRTNMRFDLEGIEIPFPRQTVYFGQDTTGTAPPARLEINSSQPMPAGIKEV
jgi:small conductance mechanosensitive channel